MSPEQPVKTTIKETPILFSAPMVRAILDGTKTQTRRIVKPQPKDAGFSRDCTVAPYCTGTKWPMAYYERRGGCWNSSDPLKCPYGKPGDRLWVRETWMPFDTDTHGSTVTIGYKASNDIRPNGVNHDAFGASRKFTRPSAEVEGFAADIEKMETLGDRWRPSIHMPRWASRITLEIISVRVERLQEISEADAMAEGIATIRDEWSGACGDFDESLTDQQLFKILWESINGPASWEANPFVWVVEFRRLP